MEFTLGPIADRSTIQLTPTSPQHTTAHVYHYATLYCALLRRAVLPATANENGTAVAAVEFQNWSTLPPPIWRIRGRSPWVHGAAGTGTTTALTTLLLCHVVTYVSVSLLLYVGGCLHVETFHRNTKVIAIIPAVLARLALVSHRGAQHS